MIGRAIRKLGSLVYKYPEIPDAVERPGPFGRLKIAMVTDYFTADCLSAECRVKALTPGNFRMVIGEWKPDLIFVESAFHGSRGSWRYELAKQPKWLRLSKPTAIYQLVEFARSRGIPTIFWNKDDDVFLMPSSMWRRLSITFLQRTMSVSKAIGNNYPHMCPSIR